MVLYAQVMEYVNGTLYSSSGVVRHRNCCCSSAVNGCSQIEIDLLSLSLFCYRGCKQICLCDVCS